MTKNLVIFLLVTFFQSGVMPLDLLKNTNFLIIYMYVSVNHLEFIHNLFWQQYTGQVQL